MVGPVIQNFEFLELPASCGALPVLALSHLFLASNSDFPILARSPSPLGSGALLTIVNAKEGCSSHKGSQELGSHIKREFEPFHSSEETHCKRHGWVDVATCKKEKMIRDVSSRPGRISTQKTSPRDLRQSSVF